MTVWQVLLTFIMGAVAGSTLTILYDIWITTILRHRLEKTGRGPVMNTNKPYWPEEPLRDATVDATYIATMAEREAARNRDRVESEAIRNKSTGA